LGNVKVPPTVQHLWRVGFSFLVKPVIFLLSLAAWTTPGAFPRHQQRPASVPHILSPADFCLFFPALIPPPCWSSHKGFLHRCVRTTLDNHQEHLVVLRSCLEAPFLIHPAMGSRDVGNSGRIERITASDDGQGELGYTSKFPVEEVFEEEGQLAPGSFTEAYRLDWQVYLSSPSERRLDRIFFRRKLFLQKVLSLVCFLPPDPPLPCSFACSDD